MFLTPIQRQIFIGQLNALAASLTCYADPADDPGLTPNEILAAMVHELGPFVCPHLADMLAFSPDMAAPLSTQQATAIKETCYAAAAELEKFEITESYSKINFRELLAKLLEQIGPQLLPLIISLLLDKNPATATTD